MSRQARGAWRRAAAIPADHGAQGGLSSYPERGWSRTGVSKRAR